MSEILAFLASNWLAEVALVAVLGVGLLLLRQLSLPTVFVISRFVRALHERKDFDAQMEKDRLRIWFQNADAATIKDTTFILDAHDPRVIQGVRVVGGAGRFAPAVVTQDRAEQFELDVPLKPGQWAIHCSAGMRPHATWRAEVDVSPEFTELDVSIFSRTVRLGRNNTSKGLGPFVQLPVFLLLAALVASLGGLGWFLADGEEVVALGLPLAIGITVGWAGTLFILIRPVQAGIMSGWGGIGRGRRRAVWPRGPHITESE